VLKVYKRRRQETGDNRDRRINLKTSVVNLKLNNPKPIILKERKQKI